jgi:diguanylate cyclase (GGDEF)-like protein
VRNILVVEDSPLVLKILEKMFHQQPDLQPLFCATMAEAQVMLETSAELLFAAIIDLNLPDAPNGEIVDVVLHYQLPCIVLTGSYDEQRREEMLLKGVVDYVQKENQYSFDYAFRLLHRLERNRSIKILVAEDSHATRHLIRNVLRSHLYQIHEAADGEQALRILREQPDFDLLITDHSMPGLSGFELTKLLRQKLKRHDLCIIGLSADSKGSLTAQFIKHGADDFLRKPFCPEELTCRVTSTLERREMLQALQRSAQIDSLTNLYNRRAFYEQAGHLLQAAARSQRPVSVAMLDLDLFKRINDNYGHASGDAALIGFAQLLQAAFGQTLIGRLGGEEFALLSPLPAEQLSAQLDQLRQQCASNAPACTTPTMRRHCRSAPGCIKATKTSAACCTKPTCAFIKPSNKAVGVAAWSWTVKPKLPRWRKMRAVQTV